MSPSETVNGPVNKKAHKKEALLIGGRDEALRLGLIPHRHYGHLYSPQVVQKTKKEKNTDKQQTTYIIDKHNQAYRRAL